MRHRAAIGPTLSLAILALAAGCRGDGGQQPAVPARISHVVLFDLRDPADAPALIADSRDSLSRIPAVVSLACGAHLETGRPNVVADYDVGLYVGFDSADGYAAYVTDPNHVGLVARWKDRLAGYRVYDVLDEHAD